MNLTSDNSKPINRRHSFQTLPTTDNDPKSDAIWNFWKGSYRYRQMAENQNLRPAGIPFEAVLYWTPR
jgi:hypothetical protein